MENSEMSLLSVIVPCWNEEEAIPFFYEEFSRVRKLFGERFPNISFELLLWTTALRTKA